MDLYDYLKFFAAFAFVMGLMGCLAIVLKKIGLGHAAMLPADKRRLKIIEILPLDARRKAVLLRRDDADHLVILGPSGETVVETHIEPNDTKQNV